MLQKNKTEQIETMENDYQNKEQKNKEVSSSSPAKDDCFVSLDIGKLSLLVSSDNKEKDNSLSSSTPRSTVKYQKSLSRKGWSSPAPAIVDGEPLNSSTGVGEKNSGGGVLVHVAGEGESWTSATTPTAAGTGRSRRSTGRRQSTWLDPRRVVIVFATLSSMGTLILLYFTLSIGRMAGDDSAKAR